MSGLTPPGPPPGEFPPPAPYPSYGQFGAPVAPAEPVEAQDPAERFRRWAVASLGDLAVVVAWSVVAGLIAAVVWWQLTPLAEYTRAGDNGSMDEQQLAKQVSSDGWFFVVAAVAGLVSGVALVWWRRRDPLLMVVLVAAGGFLATWVMVTTGLALGPADPGEVLPTVAEGAKVKLQLEVGATGLYFTWSLTALLGAIGVIWGTERR